MPYIVKHTDEHGALLRDAARPWLVIEEYHGGYKRGMQRRIVDRYETKAQANRRARALNLRF